jgi:hypothetical protein
LATLYLVGGAGVVILLVPLVEKSDDLKDPLRAAGISAIYLFISILLLGLLGIAAGIGLWSRTKWGWWLGAYYSVYAIARSITAIAAIAAMSEELPGGSRTITNHYAKHSGRIAVQVLILAYLFKGPVLEHFQLAGLSKRKAILKLIGAGLTFVGIAGILSLVAS